MQSDKVSAIYWYLSYLKVYLTQTSYGRIDYHNTYSCRRPTRSQDAKAF